MQISVSMSNHTKQHVNGVIGREAMRVDVFGELMPSFFDAPDSVS